jgi:hypothetical protein
VRPAGWLDLPGVGLKWPRRWRDDSAACVCCSESVVATHWEASSASASVQIVDRTASFPVHALVVQSRSRKHEAIAVVTSSVPRNSKSVSFVTSLRQGSSRLRLPWPSCPSCADSNPPRMHSPAANSASRRSKWLTERGQKPIRSVSSRYACNRVRMYCSRSGSRTRTSSTVIRGGAHAEIPLPAAVARRSSPGVWWRCAATRMPRMERRTAGDRLGMAESSMPWPRLSDAKSSCAKHHFQPCFETASP